VKTRGSFWFGLLLVALGILFLSESYLGMDVGEMFHTYWPVILILVGIWMLVRPSRHYEWKQGSSANVFGDIESALASDRVDSSTVFGDVELRLTSQDFKGGTVSTVFGDRRLDLTGGKVAEGEQKLKVSGVFGDSLVNLPAGLAYAVEVSTVFGTVRVSDQKSEGIARSLKYESPDYPSASRKLKIDLSGVFGDVEVRVAR
jgi:lia operon protein LiaF